MLILEAVRRAATATGVFVVERVKVARESGNDLNLIKVVIGERPERLAKEKGARDAHMG